MGRVNKKKFAKALEEANDAENNDESKSDNDLAEEDEDFQSLPDNNDPEVIPKKRKIEAKKNGNDSGAEESEDEPLAGTSKKSHKGKSSKGKKSTKTESNADENEIEEKAGGSKKSAKAGKKSKAAKSSDNNNADEEEEDDEVEEEYEVKEVVGHQMKGGKSFYLIRWKGYTKADDTWEPEDTLSCPELIEKFNKKQSNVANGKPKKAANKASPKGRAKKNMEPANIDPSKEWEVDKIIDYAQDKNGFVYRIRWKGYSAKHDTWEPRKNLFCDDLIDKFDKKMQAMNNVSFKQLREEPKKTKRLVNETLPRTNIHNPIGRTSKRNTKKRVYYGDSDE